MMNNELKHILTNSNKDINNQQLMDYVSNKLSKEESHSIEKNMAEDDFINDAVEGLQQIDNKQDMQLYVKQLDNDLKKLTLKTAKKKEKRKLTDQSYTYLTIIIILLLVVLGFIIVKKYMDARHSQPVAIEASDQRLSLDA